MAKECWINLPVKDISKSKEFFKALGFRLNERFADSDTVAGVVIGGHNSMIMLFPVETFEGFINAKIADTQAGTEMLISISVEDRDEVQELIHKAANAGGIVYAEPGERNGMYGAGFCDLDGHRWNLLVM
ncbi:VOC family protein [Planococcus sp. FY231025]|uniref:VOC family protein n=1 Tax=Planococcus chinensis TaxID=272917 RepID=A0ABW4QL19_9BACL